MAVDLFVYGTLMDDALVVRLTGRQFSKEPALLAGYRKVLPAGGYPFVVPDAQQSVEGMLLLAIDAESLRRIDTYEDEGRLYRRTEAVATAAGRRRPCVTYVGIPQASERT